MPSPQESEQEKAESSSKAKVKESICEFDKAFRVRVISILFVCALRQAFVICNSGFSAVCV